MKKIKYIDLFCGIGGLRLGFEQALKELNIKGECLFSSEIKPSAIKVYKQNFPKSNISGDITKICEKDIPNFDFLLAGFPCQAFSSAGKQLGFEDTRGTLFFDIARILKEKKPTGFILENVEGLVNHDKGKTFRVIKSILSDLGYILSYKVINGADFSLAQSRKRIYIVGNKKEKITIDDYNPKTSILNNILEKDVEVSETEFTKQLLSHFKLKDLYGKSIKDKRGGINNIHSWDIELKGEISYDQKNLLEILLKERRKKHWAEKIGITWMDGMPLTFEQIQSFFQHPKLKPMLNDLVNKGYLKYEHPKERIGNKRVPDIEKPKGYNIVTGKLSFEYSKILSPYETTPTLVATDVSRLGIPSENPIGIRTLTTREGLRLFGFPENYDMNYVNKREAFDLLGNTVCVPVIKYVSYKQLLSLKD
ncbi:DNA (cytosine-5-)-methyltransferase [Holzapfeliella sp. He02]|uniref:Cytosine-specific methyltransferase n=1 Tax=Holzapfeliella saturejae TaxID=3082953 RepID=A0ABU8SHA8_9LACO